MLNEIHHGDCLEVLKKIEGNSIESVVTDPPYGLSKEPNISEVLTKWMAGEPYNHNHNGFMGKDWDSFVPHPDIWKEIFRVLKPGGHALVFAGTRTQDLMTISLRLAGFEVRDVIEWLYFSGFPKSLDVSKTFDKRVHSRQETLKITAWIKDMREIKGITNRQIDSAFGTNGMAGHWTTQGEQASVPTLERVSKLLAILGVEERDLPNDIRKLLIDKNAEKGKPSKNFAKRKIMGEVTKARSTSGSSALPTVGGETVYRTWDITTSTTPLAQKWEGWGTELKPAHEPIIVVRKPLSESDTGFKLNVADCIETYGTGAINIDDSRIGDEELMARVSGSNALMGGLKGGDDSAKDSVTEKRVGRFPTNCITLEPNEFYSKYFNISPAELSKKASKKDRNSNWQGDEIDVGERNNVHPTVKPTDLMAWLVRLVTPPNGTVLDPFAGSGSTLVAAKCEGFNFIGIEKEKEYVDIANKRLEENSQQKELQLV